ncbi:MAG: glycosyltransferase, partial [Spirochaetes bacterium]|nr:glycosyltransferase [Spirochaetota bacterium]
AYNEEKTIKQVIKKFYLANPKGWIYVVDNNSNDNTNKIAYESIEELKCKGDVIFESRKGKGNAIRKAFLEIEADIYVIVDADLTYSEKELDILLEPVKKNECDMCVGDRHSKGYYTKENKRVFHEFGNSLVRNLINLLFKSKLRDIMSGYRVMSHFFVKNFPILSEGFEIETEITLHSLDKRFRIKEIPISYKERPFGSVSKLNTIKDGFRVLKTIFGIFKDYKPLIFFSLISLIFFIIGIIVGTPVILEFIKAQYINRIPSAILSSGLMIISMLLFAIGLILDTVVKHYRYNYEVSLLHYKNNSNKSKIK